MNITVENNTKLPNNLKTILKVSYSYTTGKYITQVSGEGPYTAYTEGIFDYLVGEGNDWQQGQLDMIAILCPEE